MSSRSIASASNRLAARVALVLGLLLLLVAPAAAQKRTISMQDFTGPRSARFQREIGSVIAQEHSIISAQRYAAAAKRLRAARTTPANTAKVAAELGADGVVSGSVRRRGSGYTITIRLREGRSGKQVKVVTVTTNAPRLTPRATRTIRQDLLGAIAELPPVGEEVRDRREAKARGKRPAPRDVPEVDDEPEERILDDLEEDDGPAAAAPRDADKPAVELSAAERADLDARGRGLVAAGGLSILGRSLDFTYDPALGLLAPQGYDGTPVAGGYVVAELYPMAFNKKNRGITRNLGVSVVFDQALKIESRLVYDDMNNVRQEAVLPTEQARYGVGVVYRHNFGDSPSSPTAKLGARYNRMKFVIDKEAAPDGAPAVDIPNIEYTFIDPGVGVVYPLSAKISLVGDARYLIVTDVGEMQEPEEYGAAKLTGFDFDLGAAYKVDARLSVMAGVRYMRIAFDFTGNGQLTNNRDGNPDTQDVFGALDSYLGGYVMAGYVF